MNSDFYIQELRLKLKLWMQKEIGIMRELLSNMLEEELALVMWDELNWSQVISSRAELIQRLKELRQEPVEVAEDYYYDSYIEQDFELDILKTQLVTLTEKMASQNLRNKQLFKAYGPNLGKPLPENWQQKLKAKGGRKKASVTTIEE